MLERYNEKARRTIFFARYEASLFGSPEIEAEFLLLGLMREDKALSMRLFSSHTTQEAIRREIERHHPSAEKIPTSVDLPLSDEAKHVLSYAAEEADRLGHTHVGTEHLFLGILREENSFASQLLQRHGVHLDEVRKDIAERQPPAPVHPSRTSASTLGFFQLALRVANLETSIDFYTKLGFTPVRVRGSRYAVLTNGSCNLRLDQNLTVDHLLFFPSPDIAPTVSRLRSTGVEFEQLPHTASDGSTTALLRDPDGNIISLFNPPPVPPT